LLIAASVAVAAGRVGTAQEPASATAITEEDEAFVKEAATGGLAEVKLGQLAVEKASDAQVKAFAQRMIDDHGRGHAELTRIAAARHIELSSDLDTKQQALADRLANLSGSSFDRAYVDAMLDDHEEDVEHFKHKIVAARDAAVKAWAARTLPTLETHLRLARELHDRLGSSVSENKDR